MSAHRICMCIPVCLPTVQYVLACVIGCILVCKCAWENECREEAKDVQVIKRKVVMRDE